MRAIRQTVKEFIVLGVFGVVMALGVNAVRSERRLSLSKNYFAMTASTTPAATESVTQPIPQSVETRIAPQPSPVPVAAKSSTELPSRSAPKTHPVGKTSIKLVKHPYQEIDVDEAIRVFNDPQTESGLNVFIDARDDEHFEEGHIPGAVPCFPYEIEKCIDNVMQKVNGVERVIVYCGGGDCEDSIFMCRELIEAGVDERIVYLYAGGWKEWSSKNLPSATGPER